MSSATCVGTSTCSYTSKWANIKGQRGDLDLTIVEIGGSVSKVVVNSVPLVLQTVTVVPGHCIRVCGDDDAGYIYNLKISHDFRHVNGHYSRSGVEFAGPGTPDAVGIFGVVYASRNHPGPQIQAPTSDERTARTCVEGEISCRLVST